MQLSVLNKDQVTANMAAATQAAAAAAGVQINLAEGSWVLAVFNGFAGIYLWLQWLILLFYKASILTTAEGADVDTFCGQFDFERLGGVASSGPITVGRYTTTSSVILAVGTVVKTLDGTQSFIVLADDTNAAWQAPNVNYPSGSFLLPAGTASVSVTVQNQTIGAAGNILAGAIGLVASGAAGIDTVTNPAAFTNGLDAEEDDPMKDRFGLFLPSLAKGTPIALESATRGVAQNITCAVLNNTQSIGGGFAPGYGVIAVDDGSGATPSSTLEAVAAAAAGTSMAPLGASVAVIQAPVVEANVALTIVCASSAIKGATQPLVEAALAKYIGSIPVAKVPGAGAPPNGILSYGKVWQIAFEASANVLNVTGLTLNGGTADIGGSPGTVVRSGTITVG